MSNKNKVFATTNNLRAQKLFVDTNIWIAILKVALPGILISLMTGIYIFADQLLLAILVPNDGKHDFVSLFGQTEQTIKESIANFNAIYGSSLSFFSVSDIIKSSISISSPLTIILNSIPLLTSVGAGVMFTQALSRNFHNKGKEIWKSSFYTAVFIALFFSSFFCLTNNFIIQASAGGPLDFSQYTNPDPVVVNYYSKVRELQLQWANGYTLMLCLGLVFNVMVQYFSLMIRAEGKMGFVAIVMFGCNILNILLDFLMISVFKMGMMGGGTATLIGWFINFGIFLIYIYYLSAKNLTWMKFRYLKFERTIPFNWGIIIPIIAIGFSVFLRNFSNSVANILFTSSLNDVANQISILHPGQSGQYYQALSGAVSPINNLFFYAIFGVVDGVRPLCAYNNAQSNYKRLKQSYWITILFALIYGFIIFTICYSEMGSYMLGWFDIGPDKIADAHKYLSIQCLLIMFVSIALGGLTMFQSTNKIVIATLIGGMQGLICFPITLYGICIPLALSASNIWAVIMANSLNGLIFSMIIFLITNYYIYLWLGKRKIKIKLFDQANNKFKIKSFKVNINSPKMSFAQKQLEKTVLKN